MSLSKRLADAFGHHHDTRLLAGPDEELCSFCGLAPCGCEPPAARAFAGREPVELVPYPFTFETLTAGAFAGQRGEA